MVLSMQRVSKRYGKCHASVWALREIDLEVMPGEYVAVTGPSGSGKSTLLAILGCLETPTSGAYLVDGVDTSTLRDAELSQLRARVFGFVFQAFHIIPEWSALRNVMAPMAYGSSPRHLWERRAADLLERVGLGRYADRAAGELSGGEKQRIAIARALANEPQVILADEPTGNLDSTSSDMVLKLLEEMWADGRTLVIASHDPAVIRRARRRVSLLDGALAPCGLVG